jgi:flagellar motor switch protein FliG
MLNMMDKNSEKNVMARVEEKDPELAEEIRKLMFVFEDLILLTTKVCKSFLKSLITKNLLLHLRQHLKKLKLSYLKICQIERLSLLKEDLEALGPTKLSDVEKAQQEIVQQVKDLEGKGKAIISRGGEGDAMV